MTASRAGCPGISGRGIPMTARLSGRMLTASDKLQPRQFVPVVGRSGSIQYMAKMLYMQLSNCGPSRAWSVSRREGPQKKGFRAV